MPLRLAVACCGAAFGGYSVWLADQALGYAFAAESLALLLLFAASGFALLAAAVFAWHSRLVPGWLLAAASAAWFVTSWQYPTARPAAAFTIGLCLAHLGPAVVGQIHLVAHLRRHSRLFILAGYVASVGALGLGSTLFFNPLGEGCGECPTNLLLVHSDTRLASALSRLGSLALLAWVIATLAVVTVRYVRAGRIRQRQTELSASGATVYLAASAGGLWLADDTGYTGYTSGERLLWMVQAAGLLALAAGMTTVMIRTRSTHAALARMVLDLETGGRAGGVQAELAAQQIWDPALHLGYRTEDGDYVDRDGQRLEVPSDPARRTPLTHAGRELAIVVHAPGGLDDPVLTRELVAAGHLALESEGLRARSLALLLRLRASRLRLIQAGDEERRRIERDLHDGAQQRLVALTFTVSLLARHANPDSARLTQTLATLEEALDGLRTLGRGIFPITLQDGGLAAALTSLTESAPVRLLAVPDRRLPALVETTAYLLVARAAAAGPVDAALTLTYEELYVTLDHGDRLPDPSLGDVVDRVDALGGDITVSDADAGGTRVLARIPITDPQ